MKHYTLRQFYDELSVFPKELGIRYDYMSDGSYATPSIFHAWDGDHTQLVLVEGQKGTVGNMLTHCEGLLDGEEMTSLETSNGFTLVPTNYTLVWSAYDYDTSYNHLRRITNITLVDDEVVIHTIRNTDAYNYQEASEQYAVEKLTDKIASDIALIYQLKDSVKQNNIALLTALEKRYAYSERYFIESGAQEQATRLKKEGKDCYVFTHNPLEGDTNWTVYWN